VRSGANLPGSDAEDHHISIDRPTPSLGHWRTCTVSCSPFFPCHIPLCTEFSPSNEMASPPEGPGLPPPLEDPSSAHYENMPPAVSEAMLAGPQEDPDDDWLVLFMPKPPPPGLVRAVQSGSEDGVREELAKAEDRQAAMKTAVDLSIEHKQAKILALLINDGA
jgi:hypothetical protein